jgi:hypothetical protein
MAGDSGEPSLGEETQLLTEETRTLAFNGSPKIQNGSAETSGEESEGLSEAYQQMGMGRGLLIVLSLWILIFLQGLFGAAFFTSWKLWNSVIKRVNLSASVKYIDHLNHPVKNCGGS